MATERTAAPVFAVAVLAFCVGMAVASPAAEVDGTASAADQDTATVPPPTTPPPPTSPPPMALPGAGAPLPAGTAQVDMGVGELDGPIELRTEHTQDGAVTALTEYAVWLIGSPGAEAETGAFRRLSTGFIYPGIQDTTALFAHDQHARFDATSGAYRRLGYSGEDTVPESVMIEVAAPYSTDGGSRWLIVGGVVRWTDAGWLLESLLPVEIPQPAMPTSELTPEQKGALLEGLGWQEFAGD